MPLSYIFHELSYPCSARYSSLYLQCFPPCCLLQLLLLLFFTLLLLLFYYYYFYKIVATDKLLRARLLSGAAELTTHLLRLISILWLPLCRINKLGFTSLEDCGDPLYLWVIKDGITHHTTHHIHKSTVMPFSYSILLSL